MFEATGADAYERGRGISLAAYFEIDDVIDPVDTRRWINTLFDDHDDGGASHGWSRADKRRPNVTPGGCRRSALHDIERRHNIS